MPGPLHPGGHSAAGLSLSPWPRMCTGLEQHQGSDDGNEERNRNAYGHSRAGRHPECGRPPAGSALGSGTGAGGGQRPAPPPRCGATWPRDPCLPRASVSPARPGRAVAGPQPAAGRSEPWPPATGPLCSMVLVGRRAGRPSPRARARWRPRVRRCPRSCANAPFCGFKEGARLGGPAPPFATVLAHVINLIKVKLVLYIVSRK